MKIKYVLPVFICLFVFSQIPVAADEPEVPPAAEWSTLFRGHSVEEVNLNPIGGESIIRVGNNYVVTGTQFIDILDPYHPPSGIGTWAALVKLDLGGTIINYSTLQTESDHNGARAVIPSKDSSGHIDGYVITGRRHVAYSEEEHDYYTPWTWLKKVDTNLGPVWEHTWKPPLVSPFTDQGNSVAQEGDGGGFIVGGQKSIGPTLNFAGYMIRTQADGTLDWAIDGYMHDGGITTYPWIGNGGTINSIIQNTDGDYIMATAIGIVKVNTNPAGPPVDPNPAWITGSASYYSVKQTSDGGYICAGTVVTSVPGADDRTDIILTKLDASGLESWSRRFGRTTEGLGASGLNDYGNDVIETHDGGYAVIGTTRSYAWHGGSDMWLIKTDSSGSMVWDLVLGKGGDDGGKALVEAPDNGLVLTGYMHWEGADRMWILKIRPGDFTPPVPAFSTSPESPFFVDENIEFDASASTDPEPGGSIVNYEWDFGDDVQGSGVIDHHAYISDATYTATLYVTDNDGVRRDISHDLTARQWKIQWERFFGQGSVGSGFAYDFTPSPDGGFVLAGYWKWSNSNFDLWVLKTDDQGNYLWDNKFDIYEHNGSSYRTQKAMGYTISPAHGGGCVVAGFIERYITEVPLFGTKGSAGWLLKINEIDGTDPDTAPDAFEIGWEQLFEGGVHVRLNDIEQTLPPDDGYIVTGYTNRYIPDPDPSETGVYRNDLWLIKTDNLGNPVWDDGIGDDGRIPGPDPLNDGLEGLSVVPASDGGFAATGSLYRLYGSSSTDRIYTLKVDSNGDKVWEDDESTEDQYGYSYTKGHWIGQASDAGFRVVGNVWKNLVIHKFDADGNWDEDASSDLGPDPLLFPSGVAQNIDGGLFIAGQYYLDWDTDPYYDIFILRTDSQGNIAWEWDWDTYPTEGIDETARQIHRLPDGSLIVLGNRGPGGHGQGVWLFKIGANNLPTGDFTYTPDPPRVGYLVSFEAEADDPDGSIAGYEWHFGDIPDIPATGDSATYTYGAEGDYTVRLIITDNDGGETVITRILTVISGAAPGDINGDGDIDGEDIALFIEAFDTVDGDDNYNPAADLDGDGDVDFADLDLFADYFG